MSDARATADFIWRHNTNLNFLLTFITKEPYSKARYFKIGRSFAGILLKPFPGQQTLTVIKNKI